MKGKDFFNNLRASDDTDFDFTLPNGGNVPPTTNDVVQSLSQELGANNINITLTINRGLFDKIESIQKQIEAKRKCKVSKSKIIARICEQYLENYEVM